MLLIISNFYAAYNSFDSPSAVAAVMTGSLAGVMEALSPEIPPPQSMLQGGYGRTIDLADDSRVNIYILLDTSGSMTKHFNDVRNAAIILIRKVCTLSAQYDPSGPLEGRETDIGLTTHCTKNHQNGISIFLYSSPVAGQL